MNGTVVRSISAHINNGARVAITRVTKDALACVPGNGVGALCPKSTIVCLLFTLVNIFAVHTIAAVPTQTRAREAAFRVGTNRGAGTVV
jgi:hypothetical protein